jgi:predicted metalloprotease with PDZ domain
MTSFRVVHRVSLPEPKTHLVHVETTVESTSTPPADGIVLFMPVWTPGSYLVREYARHVEGFEVEDPARFTKIRKNAWRIDMKGAPRLVVRYRVHAGELTVRTSHVDETHAFLVGAALFLGIEGREDVGARIEIDAPRGWSAATSLPRIAHDEAGPLVFEAPDFDTLVDSPIEVGTHRQATFAVQGKTHRYSIWPADAARDADVARLVDDSKSIFETEARLFGGVLPYERYELLLHLSARGRGGLEHRSCAALVASPTCFAARDAYLDLLSLVAHEAFHAWNVKRIRPAGLTPYRYEEECYTRSLWWFEGATSYYDWRVLALSGLCTLDEYLEHIAGEIAYLDQTPGRLVHALEDASFDAWIKLYRPDENSANSTVSYYRKGEVVCALLDVEIRTRTLGRASLDRVLAYLWENHGAAERPVPEGELRAIFERVAGVSLGDVFDAWIRSPGEIDYEATLSHVGLALERTARSDVATASLGVRMRTDSSRAIVASVTRESAAWRTGIDAGDEIVAVGGARVDGTNVDTWLRGKTPGEEIEVVIARDGRLKTKRAVVDPPRKDRVKIVPRPDASASVRDAFAAWLGAPHPCWTGRDGRNGVSP